MSEWKKVIYEAIYDGDKIIIQRVKYLILYYMPSYDRNTDK